MPVPLPPGVLVGCVWTVGHIGRSVATLAPRLPVFYVIQLEGACVQQRLVERQELAWCRCLGSHGS